MDQALSATLDSSSYAGKELELFQFAENWKAYWASAIRPYLGRSAIEVGAGIGASTKALCRNSSRERWLCLEPDASMAKTLRDMAATGELPAYCLVQHGTIGDVPPSEAADTVLYIDVLEHIASDAKELETAVSRVRPGGHVIVLAPAHQFLFSPFDTAIGHYRRYSKNDARRLTPPGLVLESAFYLDSIGLLASLANRILLRSAMPTRRQIQVWDRFMVPLSKIIDRLLAYRAGKSVVMVWKRADTRIDNERFPDSTRAN